MENPDAALTAAANDLEEATDMKEYLIRAGRNPHHIQGIEELGETILAPGNGLLASTLIQLMREMEIYIGQLYVQMRQLDNDVKQDTNTDRRLQPLRSAYRGLMLNLSMYKELLGPFKQQTFIYKQGHPPRSVVIYDSVVTGVCTPTPYHVHVVAPCKWVEAADHARQILGISDNGEDYCPPPATEGTRRRREA